MNAAVRHGGSSCGDLSEKRLSTAYAAVLRSCPERDRERLQCWLPAHGPSLLSVPLGVQLTGSTGRDTPGGLLGRGVSPHRDGAPVTGVERLDRVRRARPVPGSSQGRSRVGDAFGGSDPARMGRAVHVPALGGLRHVPSLLGRQSSRLWGCERDLAVVDRPHRGCSNEVSPGACLSPRNPPAGRGVRDQ